MVMNESIKSYLDWVAMGNVVATVMGFLPHIAALLTIVWTGIRIYEYFKTKKVD